MLKVLSILFLTAGLLVSPFGFALSAANQRSIEQIINGGPISIRDAAEDIYRSGENSPEVLDVLAEATLRNYKKSDRDYVDAIAWACKALGNAAQPRYRDVLTEVAENGGHRKSKKYAKTALDQLPAGDAAQYVKGSATMTKVDAAPASSQEKTVSKSKTTSKPTELQPITEVKKGMSMEAAYALVGQPDASTSHQTGKAWVPFNYRGGDLVRMEALYKGQGRIVFSNQDRYSQYWRVLEVRLNPNESGYP